MRITLIAAVARNRAIGVDNDLPWHLPEDFKSFQRLTTGQALLMGRRTWESIDERALPKRLNIVLSGSLERVADGVVLVRSLAEGIGAAREAGVDELFIAGGGGVYEAAAPFAHRMILTEVEAEVEGHAFFPALDMSRWRLVERTDFPADDRHTFAFAICRYDRVGEPARPEPT